MDIDGSTRLLFNEIVDNIKNSDDGEFISVQYSHLYKYIEHKNTMCDTCDTCDTCIKSIKSKKILSIFFLLFSFLSHTRFLGPFIG